jgi:hypothetical protein
MFSNKMLPLYHMAHPVVMPNGQVVNAVPFWSPHLTPGVFNPPPGAAYVEVPYSLPPESMKKVIGKEGSVFKAITHQTRVYYIWKVEERDAVGIWGPPENLEAAAQRIRDRLRLIGNQDFPSLK